MGQAISLVMCFVVIGAEPQKEAGSTQPAAVDQFLKAMETYRVSELQRLADRVEDLAIPSTDRRKRRAQRKELQETKRLIRQLKSSANKIASLRGKEGQWNLPKLQPSKFQGGQIGIFDTQKVTFTVFQASGKDGVIVKAKYAVKPPGDGEEELQTLAGTEPVIRNLFLIRGIPTKELTESEPIDLSGQVFQVLGVKNWATGIPGARVVSMVGLFDMKPVTDWFNGHRSMAARRPDKNSKPKKDVPASRTVAEGEKRPLPTPPTKPAPLSKAGIEKRATAKLKLALKFLKTKPSVARRRLKEIRKKYPETEAAREAAEHLKKLDG